MKRIFRIIIDYLCVITTMCGLYVTLGVIGCGICGDAVTAHNVVDFGSLSFVFTGLAMVLSHYVITIKRAIQQKYFKKSIGIL